MSSIQGNKDAIGSETLSVIGGAPNFNQWMYDSIKMQLKGYVLELGSGTGNISELVLKDNFETVLSDYNMSYLEQLKKKFSGYTNLHDVLSVDLQDPFFENNYRFLSAKFDTIFLLNVIEHLKDDGMAVSNCKYMLKSGGRLILLAPSYNFLYCRLDQNLGHHRRYTKHTLAALLKKNHLVVIEKKYFNLTGIAGWLLWGKLLKKGQLEKTSMGIFNKLVPLFRLADKLVLQRIGLSAIATGKKI